MKISAKTDYACRAILVLSLNWPKSEPIQIGYIAEKQKIPIQFLTQILINLKQLGYVESIRGKNGGYRLVIEPKEIKLGALVRNIEQDNSVALNTEAQQDIFNSIWAEMDKAILKIMDDVNFEILVNKQRSQDNVVMFEI